MIRSYSGDFSICSLALEIVIATVTLSSSTARLVWIRSMIDNPSSTRSTRA